MIVETVELTPEDAQKLLNASQGSRQRVLRKSLVERIEHAIRTGQWRETHQPIALNADGVVIDGQHRLTAIARADRPVMVMIARGVPDETFDVIDTGAARGPSDVLTLGGFTNAAQLAAAVRMMLAYDVVVGSTDSFGSVRKLFTSAEILQAAQSERGSELERCLNATRVTSLSLGRAGFAPWL